jgi:branched-chain amino acid transport system ATP-binding protein
MPENRQAAALPGSPLLRLQGLCACYGEARALDDISLEVAPGSIAAVIGPNGAGKSTLLKVISGVMPASAGRLMLDGREAGHEPVSSRVRAGIAHCPEGRRIFPFMTVRENLEVGGFTIRGKRVIDSRIDRIFDLFPKLRERERQLAGTLSGGEQQMVAIGRALMIEPKLLLLDEPSLGLSPVMAELVSGYIRDIRNEGVGIVLVEQNAELALRLSDIAYILENGRVVLQGTPADVAARDDVRRAYLGA